MSADFLEPTPHGPVRVIEHRLETAWPYSAVPIDRILTPEVAAGAARLTDRRADGTRAALEGFERDKALFLDVETTGLSCGAGTVAFLVGIGWFESGRFVLRQILLDDYDQEQAQLHLLLERLDRHEFLVSYNGKSFDRNVLENRLVIHRFLDRNRARLRLMPHLDLLHLGRRLYRRLLESHTLSNMEAEVLGYRRTDDVPGALVPQYYFQYLLTRDPAAIEPVLRHNFDDVLSMAHLAHALLGLLAPPPSWPPLSPPSSSPLSTPCSPPLCGDPVLALNVGRLLLSSGFHQEARAHLSHAAALAPEVPALEATKLLCMALRRVAAPWQEAEQAWVSAAGRFPAAPLPQVELAKLYEHRGRDPARALEHASRALEMTPGDQGLAARVRRLHTTVSGRRSP